MIKLNCDEEVIFKEELRKLYLEFSRCQEPSVKLCIRKDIDIVQRALVIIGSK